MWQLVAPQSPAGSLITPYVRGWVGGLVECGSTVRGQVSGGWPCTSTPEPRIQLAEGHGG